MRTSRLTGFYKLSIDERRAQAASTAELPTDDLSAWMDGGLSVNSADHMVENVVGMHSLPVGLGLNFQINGRDVLIPMAIEEPSVVAGASFMAKLARSGGGFQTTSSAPQMIGQMQVIHIKNLPEAALKIYEHKDTLLAAADEIDPVLKKFGGGARDLEVRIFNDSPVGGFIVIHLVYDVRDAMGANAVNTACERLAPQVEAITGGKVHLRILSNLADRRISRARCSIPTSELAFDGFSGESVRDGIIAAYAFAAVDPYRAATHNKGIMNGIDPVVIATGNDWRAIEAGAHAYAARNGRYTSLSTWGTNENGDLVGTLEMPMAVGIIGGATKVHPAARAALKLMGVRTASELAEVIVAVGLAQNMAALRALATEGIQRGHMSLHARQVAIAAGASGDMIDIIAAQMVAEKTVRIDRAEELLQAIK